MAEVTYYLQYSPGRIQYTFAPLQHVKNSPSTPIFNVGEFSQLFTTLFKPEGRADAPVNNGSISFDRVLEAAFYRPALQRRRLRFCCQRPEIYPKPQRPKLCEQHA
jgi:hypothetical protein